MTAWGLDDVTVRLGDVTALDRVSMDVAPGQVVAVVGGDGAGKTTMGRVLSGLTRVTHGAVRRPRGHGVGYQPAGSGVWHDMTVAENLAFVASAFHIGKTDFRSRLDAMLEATRLVEARHRLAAHLSGGMRQKLGVAMALLPRPQLLVLDEPTTGVDPVSRFELWRLVSQAAADGTAVVMTTTYLDEAERASVILALDEGRTLAWGDLAAINRSLRGRVSMADHPVDTPFRWRRGAGWRVWTDGDPLPSTRQIEPDLNDVLTAAAIARDKGGSA